MSTVAVIQTLLLTVLVLLNGATEKPESACHETAQAQYDATQHIPLSQAQAGDLVFFHSTYNTSDYVTHVGIYVGNNQMYHAGNPIGYTDLTSAYWQQHIICAGRIKQ
mgnify:CR=1 FL=1